MKCSKHLISESVYSCNGLQATVKSYTFVLSLYKLMCWVVNNGSWQANLGLGHLKHELYQILVSVCSCRT